jgi:hypothetical protein
MVRYIVYPVDGARVTSAQLQAPQPWVVLRPSVIQSRTGMRMSIPLGDFRVATGPNGISVVPVSYCVIIVSVPSLMQKQKRESK